MVARTSRQVTYVELGFKNSSENSKHFEDYNKMKLSKRF